MLIKLALILSFYIMYKKKKAKQESMPVFMFAMWFWIIGAFISRIFLSIFDFMLTKFDQTTYTQPLNVLIWKLGFVSAAIGLIYMLWVADKVLMQNKFKGIFVYLMIIGQVVLLVYPVRVGVAADFQILNYIALISSVGLLVIPVIFIMLASKTSGEIRQTSIKLAIGVILYGLAAALVGDAVIGPLMASANNPDTIQVIMYFVSTGLKILGLLLVTSGAQKFHM